MLWSAYKAGLYLPGGEKKKQQLEATFAGEKFACYSAHVHVDGKS